MQNTGFWLVGGAGNVATCTALGWAGLELGILEPIGLVTESAPFSELGLVRYGAAVFGGHEIRSCRIRDTAAGLVAERVLPADLIDRVGDRLDAYQDELRPGISGRDGGFAEFARVRADLADFAARHRLRRVVVLHVASTEAPLSHPVPETVDEFFAALEDGMRLPPSAIYAAAALDLGFGFVNFTPSIGSGLSALARLAEMRGGVHAGNDGKTGETLIKTALAPMFEARRLLVQSWFSQNVLGNNDGKALSDDERRATKVQSKRAAVDSILGYSPEAHVGIDYLPSFGDWKVAWDYIQFRGFAGVDMTMTFTWRGSDTALAAPLCIDLLRLTEYAQRRGERGVLAHLALFFKSPMGTDEHRLGEQNRLLHEHLSARASRPPPGEGDS